jgi:hypothetical protein
MFITIARSLYDLLKKRYVVYAVLVSLPSIYFPFIDYFGDQLGLLKNDHSITLLGGISTVSIILICFLLALLTAIGDKYEQEVTKNGNMVLSKLLSVTKDSRESKFHYYKSFVTDVSKVSICKNISPHNEINKELVKFRSVLSDITDIPTEQIGISIFYKLYGSSFERISTDNIDADPNSIIRKPYSTISYMINSGTSLVFLPDKKSGIIDHQYEPGSKDNFYNNIGSIYCEKFNINSGSLQYIESYLSITTYGLQFCGINDNTAKDKLVNVIIPVLKDQIRIELAKLYIATKKVCPNRDKN